MKKDIFKEFTFTVRKSDTSDRWIAKALFHGAEHVDGEDAEEYVVHGATAISAMVECMEKVAEVEGA
jgi:hypothetical protein